MGLIDRLRGLSHEQVYMLTNQEKARLQQQERQYNATIAQGRARVKEALARGNKSLATQMSGHVARYATELAKIQEQIGDVEAFNMHALNEMSEQQRGRTDLPGLIKYGRREAERLTELKKPYAAELRQATNGLAKAQELSAATMSGVVSDAYVPPTAQAVLDEIVTEMETSKQQNAADKGAIKAAAAAAGA